MRDVILAVPSSSTLPTPWAFLPGVTAIKIPSDSPENSSEFSSLIAHLRGTVDALVVHGEIVESPCLADAVAPRVFLRFASLADTAWSPTSLGGVLSHVRTQSLEGESYGALLCSSHLVQAWAVDSFVFPARTHGAAAPLEDGRVPRLWASVGDLGTPIAEDHPAVVRAIVAAHRGQGPLYLQDRFCTAIPRTPQVFEGEVSGLLVAPAHPGAPWRVLSREDCLYLLGYPQTKSLEYVAWRDLSRLVPACMARAFVEAIRGASQAA